MTYHVRETCRLCNSSALEVVLHLNPTPPANEFVKTVEKQEKFPLYLVQCQDCKHVQLPVVVDPERLFRDYVYVSGTSPSFVAHFDRYAQAMIQEHGLKPGDLVVEIGSNDGTMLRAFQRAGMRVVGVDPAQAIAEQAIKNGVETWAAFFNRKIAREIHRSQGTAATLVVANNVFAHADDLREIALGVRDILDPARGRFVFEVQYLVDLVDKTLFDMIYHEHLSYHHLAPLVPFFDSMAMSLVDAEHVDTHGGSIRCTVSPRKNRPKSERLQGMLTVEASSLAGDVFGAMQTKIGAIGGRLRSFLWHEHASGRTVAGYGAPAKMTTLCHWANIGSDYISYVVDDSPWKQGLLTPGKHIPVVPLFAKDHAPDSFVVFAWNFAPQIAAKLRDSGFKGTIVTPLPEFKELS